MSRPFVSRLASLTLMIVLLAGCAPATAPAGGPAGLKVLAAETFLADIAQNVAGDRLKVAALIPIGVDPHGFQPTPADVKKVAASQVLIVNGAGFEEFLADLLENAGGERVVIEASDGLTMREAPDDPVHAGGGRHEEGDPHFWLDPALVVKYVENIRDGLSQADPPGAQVYAANADAYIIKLKALDTWITEQVKQIPEQNRRLVTNHESLGYFADRYGFTVVGAIVPSVSAGASPSARELAELVNQVKQARVKAIFLETGTNPQLARQVAQEAGVKTVTELYSHSITDPKGATPTYIDIMRFNVRAIVDALK